MKGQGKGDLLIQVTA